jgi:hypothetical protein
VKETAPNQCAQTPKLESIAELLLSAPKASHGGSLVIHKSKTWVKSLMAVLEQLPASSGVENCGLCRSDAREQFSDFCPVSALNHSHFSGAAVNLGRRFYLMLLPKIVGGG